MPAHTRRSRSARTTLAAVAVAELVCGILLLGMGRPSHPRAPRAAGHPARSGRVQPHPTGSSPAATKPDSTVPLAPSSTTTTPLATATPSATGQSTAGPPAGSPAGTSGAAGSGVAAANPPAPEPGTGGPSPTSSAAAAEPVRCQTNLPLAQAPDTGYSFLCQQGTAPLTWRKSNLVIYDQGLTPLQTAAFAAAVPQWEADAKFQVSYATDSGAADVVVTSQGLNAGQPGYTEDGYTTVSYRCQPVCGYDHADVVLSSSASLTQTDWLSTVLHELGHVAGLDHVAQKGEVMYPSLTVTSPVLYGAGDRAGLAALAAERGA